jgi:hypothetical protein
MTDSPTWVDKSGQPAARPQSGTDLYPRKCGLVVTTGAKALDLSELRIRFQVEAMDIDRPQTAAIRVYNLSDATAKQIKAEYQSVSLQAGFQNGQFGVIFSGTIMQYRRGRESAIDSYVDLLCAAGDKAHNASLISKTLAAGSSLNDRAQAALAQMQKDDPTVVKGEFPTDLGTGGILPRGKVLFGLSRAAMSDVADTNASSWSIGPDGVLRMVKLTGYAAGDIVKLTSRTGMVLIPEQTQNGIKVSCLLNPLIKVGGRVQIDNKSINTTTVQQQGFPAYSDIALFASTAADGIYRAIVIEHHGDTRGPEWDTDLVCLALDPSSPSVAGIAGGVQAYG